MGKKVLVINNTAARTPGYHLLIKKGYWVDAVHSTDAGLQQLQARAYDIIITQEGWEAESWRLCETIRRFSNVPLIVISKNASTDTCVRAINAGADYFLRKPFGPLELIARIQSLLYRISIRRPTPVSS